MSKRSFTGILLDSDDGERVTVQNNSYIGDGVVRISRPGSKQEPIDLWTIDLKKMLEAIEEWEEESDE